jgi:hypothetical protein
MLKDRGIGVIGPQDVVPCCYVASKTGFAEISNVPKPTYITD